MPAVVVCPSCQKKARVPESMLGQPVKCPACGANFPAPTEGAETELTPAVEPTAARPPLPADADELRSARAAVGVQFVAHILYAVAMVLFLLLCLVGFVGSTMAFGPRQYLDEILPVLLAFGAAIVLLISGLTCLVGGSIGILSPPTYLARGLAVAVLVLSMISFLQLATLFGWVVLILDQVPVRSGGVGVWSWAASGLIAWFVEIARLAVLALYWRAMSRILRDARGSALARRLAVGGPAAQAGLAVVWVVFAFLGAPAEALFLLAVVGWLAMQLIVVVAGIGVIARLRRRLRAAVPD